MAEIEGIWGKRLKEARSEAGLSQRQLGIDAGLDPGIASVRINRYELGVHKADYKIAENIAKVLNVPTSYFYTADDELAQVVLIFHRSSKKKRGEILKTITSSLT